jgi:neutral ceramidase
VKVGYSVVDITPDLGIELSGYGWYLGRKAEGIIDRLYARGIAFEDNDIKMLIINCDLIAIDENISDYVKEKLSEAFGLSKTNIMIVCTHTHTGPATGKLIGCGEPDEEYRRLLAVLLLRTGRIALESFREVTCIKSFKKEIDPISVNRVKKDGPLDKSVRGMVFYFREDEGRPLALLSYGCHPVSRGNIKEISADYPGAVVRALADEGYDGVFMTGLCGDINPTTHKGMVGGGTSEIINEYGTRIVKAMINTIDNIEPMKDIKLDAFEFDVNLKLQQYKEKEIDRQVEIHEANKDNSPGIFKAVKIWAKVMRDKLQNEENPYIEVEKIHVFRIGDVLIVGFPGEAFTHIGTIIRNEMPDMNILTVGNSNSTMRYIPTRDDIENMGYAALSSCFLYQRLPLEPGEGERMAEIVAKEIKQQLWDGTGDGRLC